MQTLNEKRGVVIQAYLQGLWPADCWEPLQIIVVNGATRFAPAGNPDGQRNLELLQKEINSIPEDEEVDIDYARKLFYRLRDLGNNIKQTLVRKPVVVVQQAPEPADPRTAIPHQNLFPGVDTVEKCIRHIKNGRVSANQMTEINQLLDYLRAHDLRDYTPLDADDKQGFHRGANNDSPIQGRSQESASVDSASSARALVNNLKPTDIGGSFSGRGGSKWEQLLKAQTRLHGLINSLLQQRKSEKEIVSAVRTEIDALGSASIR